MKFPVKHIALWAISGIVLVIVLVAALPLIFWRVWDGYHAPQAERAVAEAAGKLAKGEVVSWLRLRPSVAQADLSDAFASGFEVSDFDPVGISLNAYEIKVRVANGDHYVFDAFKLRGQWHLHCCGHWSHSKAAEETPNLSMELTATRPVFTFSDD